MIKKVKTPKKKTKLQELELKLLILVGENTNFRMVLQTQYDRIKLLTQALQPFTFPNDPLQFAGNKSSFTNCMLKDEQVQFARQVYNAPTNI